MTITVRWLFFVVRGLVYTAGTLCRGAVDTVVNAVITGRPEMVLGPQNIGGRRLEMHAA